MTPTASLRPRLLSLYAVLGQQADLGSGIEAKSEQHADRVHVPADRKRKLYCNASITFVSALVAIVIGGVKALGLLSDKLALNGGIWDALARANERFGVFGYAIVAAFMACWIGSVLFHRRRRPAGVAVNADPRARRNR